MHAAREGALGGLEDQVVVVGHQSPCVKDPAEAVDGSRQNPEEDEPVGVIEKDRALLVAAGGDVPERAWKPGVVVDGPCNAEAPSGWGLRSIHHARKRRFLLGMETKPPRSGNESTPWRKNST